MIYSFIVLVCVGTASLYRLVVTSHTCPSEHIIVTIKCGCNVYLFTLSHVYRRDGYITKMHHRASLILTVFIFISANIIVVCQCTSYS